MNAATLSRNLSQNLRRIRSERGLTQAGLATLSEVPRPTIAKLEAGSPNPTLHVLAQVAAALRVGIDELLAPPPAVGRLYGADELVIRVERGVERRQLVPHPIPGATLERMAFGPGARLSGAPHPRGSREYLAVETGQIQLTTPSERWTVGAGEVLEYRGDQTHGYTNPGSSPALAFTLVLHAG
ncbi:MAG: XRE family transcriptional regulator [Myxococcota bacterium]